MNIVVGTCDGTGAAINVCLGFTPSFVQVYNLEDATDLPSVVWHKSMRAVAAVDEGILDKTAAGIVRSDLAADGISHYAGGDSIVYSEDNARWETPAGDSAEEVYVDGNYNRDASADAAYKCFGDRVIPSPRDNQQIKTVPGFTIGADADLNVNGQQLVFVAYR